MCRLLVHRKHGKNFHLCVGAIHEPYPIDRERMIYLP
jgi:hypothetical protein